MKRGTCALCKTVRTGKCPIFKETVIEQCPNFGGQTSNIVFATIFSTVDTVGCDYAMVIEDE